MNDIDIKFEMLVAVMVAILGEDMGVQSAKKAIEMQCNKDFDKIRKVAGQQAVALIRDQKNPMGLSHVLFGHPFDKVYGLDSKNA